ncbi:hypothetical protein N3C_1462 [Clostridium sp. N3C]|uniref:PssE/Cps14G family polysaccharide biosynthesis glycosyltransferase n=1 Tax=Clostridium sp. N3C TaxID=1776758 RepID=UPI00092DFE57|nr:PssE/Cps14G family polysaccharide biosynthesis glycosyltransferase [Clostridium sp. N3C]SCN23729.1 hypothetical protein N3C_1462 [Clostridium sp. N3C]
MIFVTLGSQKFQFNRLLQKIDALIEEKVIKEEVFAQIGYSSYKPKYFEYEEFLDRDKFAANMKKCNIVITHGGTGAIIGAVKQGKKVIAVPRLSKYDEHVDDHQLQIIKQFDELNIIAPCYDCEDLKDVYNNLQNMKFNEYTSNTYRIIESIELFIKGIRL